MLQLGLLITNRHRLLSVAAILDVFESVNSFYERANQPHFFNIKLFSPDPDTGRFYGAYPMTSIHEFTKQDLILIPAFGAGDVQLSMMSNLCCIPWLWEQY